MISIDKVSQIILALTNSDVRGNVTPFERNNIINNVVEEIYEGYFGDITRFRNRQNRGLAGIGFENQAEQSLEKLLYFLKEGLIDNSLQLPTDARYIDAIYTTGGIELEECKNTKEFNTVKGIATTSYPIFLKNGTAIKIAPTGLAYPLSISYLRNPVPAKWTYTVVGETEIFNPSAVDFRDIDLHPSEESNVIIKTLMRFGINLQEKDLQVVAQSQDNQRFNEEITS